MRTIIALTFVAFLVTACGKKGPLVYPEMLVPAAPSNVAVQQSGNSLKLSFALPSKDRSGRSLLGLAGVTILKRDAMAGQLPGCPACTDDYSLFRKLNLDLLPTGTQRNGSLIFLLDGDVRYGREYSYIVTAFTRENVAGASSAPITGGMVQPPLPPLLKVSSQPTQINLEFVGSSQVDGTFAGYNLYRAVKGEAFSYWPLNSESLKVNQYSDVGLERGTTYVYAVRSIVRSAAGAVVESGMSDEVEGKLKDDE
jgi:predicted small lipoprotein YifL